jgi:hypothetical protein
MNNPNTGGVPGLAIAINNLGAFYESSYNGVPLTTDRGRIPGGTPKAQAFILLHELGHFLGILNHDVNNQAAVDTNDKNIDKNCAKAVKSF